MLPGPDSYYGNRLLKRTQPRLFRGREVGQRSLEASRKLFSPQAAERENYGPDLMMGHG
jgi:hypothetical protein